MPDLSLGSDPLASAFAAFKADADGEIEAPGPAGARRTVRHRRVRTAAVAACVLIATTGFAIAGGRHAVRSAPTTKKPVSEAALVTRADTAIGAIAPLLGSEGVQAYGLGDGAVDSPPDNSDIGTLATVGDGTYELVVACAGVGTIQVTVYRAMKRDKPTGAPATSLSVPCNSTLIHGQIRVTKGEAGTLWITSGGDRAAIGHAGMAYGLIEPFLSTSQLNDLRLQAEAAAGRADGVRADGFVDSDVLTGNSDTYWTLAAMGVTSYTMEFYCRGAGQVTVVWKLDNASTSAVVSCGNVPGTHLLLSSDTAVRMSVEVAPLLGTQGHAAYAAGMWPELVGLSRRRDSAANPY